MPSKTFVMVLKKKLPDHFKDNILFSSSMLALQGGGLVHGLAVVPDQQTRGRGRGSNLWISPPGILN